MLQILKHYWINRDTGAYATTPANGYMIPNIIGLEIIHRLVDENGMEFCLSTCPEYLERNVIISGENLLELQSRQDVIVVSFTEIVPVEGDTNPQVFYDVFYKEKYVISITDGIWIINQTDWDSEISLYDSRQEQKRYNLLRPIRDQLLLITDWIVIKSKEQDLSLDIDFKTWRQELRDLPSSQSFPSGFPQLPSIIQNDDNILKLYARWNEIKSIPMINDPLSVE